MKIELKPLATIHTPFESLENMPVQPCGSDGCLGKIGCKSTNRVKVPWFLDIA